MRQFCNLAYEGAPSDVAEEEQHNNRTFVPLEQFNSAHTKEVSAMKARLNHAIKMFADLLKKFDHDHSTYTAEETTIIGDILDHNMTTSDALKAVRGRKGSKKDGDLRKFDSLFSASLKADADWQEEFSDLMKNSLSGQDIVDAKAPIPTAETSSKPAISPSGGSPGKSRVNPKGVSNSTASASSKKAASKSKGGIGALIVIPHHKHKHKR
jgi:hypothetical protein